MGKGEKVYNGYLQTQRKRAKNDYISKGATTQPAQKPNTLDESNEANLVSLDVNIFFLQTWSIFLSLTWDKARTSNNFVWMEYFMYHLYNYIPDILGPKKLVLQLRTLAS